jgi:signal transduction histidine kinase/ligand-binding sensor domain-containing protein
MKADYCIYIFKILLLVILACPSYAQQVTFNRVQPPPGKTFEHVTGIVQDKYGYMWFASKRGLFRYDGYKMISYKNIPLDPNSLATDALETICVDSSGIIWIGTLGSGLESLDPITGKINHHRHNPNQKGSLNSDWVTVVMTDHQGILWVGTSDGLQKYDVKTNSFKHYQHSPGNNTSISSNDVRAIYEDRKKTIWVGTGSPYGENGNNPTNGGLNKFDRRTEKFTRYIHEPDNPRSLMNNKVRSIFEDSRGNFWIGTAGDGLHKMDRANGTFLRYRYDPRHPEKLSRPPISKAFAETDHITFIKEDGTGALWIGTSESGINYYNSKTGKTVHYESAKDTSGAFVDRSVWWAYTSREGVLWISTLNGGLYRVNAAQKTIPFYPLPYNGVNSFYEEANGTLWMGTERGFIQKNPDSRIKEFLNNPQDPNSNSNNSVQAIYPNDEGNIWIGTFVGGMQFFDKKQGIFTTYLHNPKNSNSLCNNSVLSFFEDADKNLWIGTFKGLDRMNQKTKKFTHYIFYPEDTLSFGSNAVTSVLQDRQGRWWASCWMKGGVQLFHPEKGKLKTYLKGNSLIKIYQDLKGELWVGGDEGLFKYDNTSDSFYQFFNPITDQRYNQVKSFIEDDKQNLWLSTSDGIIKIDRDRKENVLYDKNYGINELNLSYGGCYKGQSGKLYFGDIKGYYSFFPLELFKDVRPPEIIFSNFYLANNLIQPGTKDLLPEFLSDTKKIRLGYNQNVFSFDFAAIDYLNPEENRHLFMLENYDNNWHEAGLDHKASYYNVPPGKYSFRVKAFNGNGASAEKSIDIIITPPWWQTWWAYAGFSVVAIALLWSIIHFRSRSLIKEKQQLEKKVLERTAEVVKQKEEMAIQRDSLKQALEELKGTQAQLVQREKMASLGELTAGIAHEIQNPLNFVNNFSDVNTELIDEMKSELKAGNHQEAISIADIIYDNEQKINHHGKRADAIIKGMLQHSRISSGQKEPTDINALSEEYLRLAYHGLRAKDKSFNATINTDYDNTIGKVNIIPQEIGRVILNLITNSFYTVTEKRKQAGDGYEPVVTVSTKRLGSSSGNGGKVEIKVKDNGNGIPHKVLDKIFQPFFTTKPTGQGTGLGLSLSYDIIKAHGGELSVETKEGEGSEFIIQLPNTNVL